MKLLGLIGGMSWESTKHYYELLNTMARERLGGMHSARILLWSVDFAPIARMQEAGDWAELARILSEAARRLQGAGAEAILVCANTMHLVADEIASQLAIPLIHIADVTVTEIKARNVRRPLLMATRFTMEKDFYLARLSTRGVDAIVPDPADRAALHAIIFDELVQSRFTDASRARLVDIVEKERARRGVDGVILGCTEFGILAPPGTFTIPSFDTAAIHCAAAMEFALAHD